jgi:L-asparaginase
MRDDKAFLYNSSIKRHTSDSEFNIRGIKELPKVEILMFYIDAGIDILDYVSKNSDGLILAGVGSGGSSSEWNKKIEDVMSSGVPVVRSSRIANGLVTYDKSEIGKKGIYADNLSPQKARILLTLALTKTHDIEKIQKMFETY